MSTITPEPTTFEDAVKRGAIVREFVTNLGFDLSKVISVEVRNPHVLVTEIVLDDKGRRTGDKVTTDLRALTQKSFHEDEAAKA